MGSTIPGNPPIRPQPSPTWADSSLPSEMSGETRASLLLSMEAEAEFLSRETELTGKRVHFRSPDDEIGGGGEEDLDGMSG